MGIQTSFLLTSFSEPIHILFLFFGEFQNWFGIKRILYLERWLSLVYIALLNYFYVSNYVNGILGVNEQN